MCSVWVPTSARLGAEVPLWLHASQPDELETVPKTSMGYFLSSPYSKNAIQYTLLIGACAATPEPRRGRLCRSSRGHEEGERPLRLTAVVSMLRPSNRVAAVMDLHGLRRACSLSSRRFTLQKISLFAHSLMREIHKQRLGCAASSNALCVDVSVYVNPVDRLALNRFSE